MTTINAWRLSAVDCGLAYGQRISSLAELELQAIIDQRRFSEFSLHLPRLRSLLEGYSANAQRLSTIVNRIVAEDSNAA